tara:strand:+ start:1709 stop:1840 length:132 start_codon:yes stop_codon:yes gene_type:complete
MKNWIGAACIYVFAILFVYLLLIGQGVQITIERSSDEFKIFEE